MDIINNNPFVGARSYEEKDQGIFYGREQEATDLFQLIGINSFTLLYGKSGLGKTSVLQAGLFPKLRAANYFPIYVRPNYRDINGDFIKEAENIIKKQLIDAQLSHENIISKETLWEYFHRQQFADEKGNIITLVLVFDQFEEIFTLGTQEKSSELRQNTKLFVEFLSDLIENSPPQLIEEEKRIELQFEYGSRKPAVKTVFSFRQEYLGDFYELSKYIPSIAYSNLQYKLGPLTFEKGFAIIKSASKSLFQTNAINQTLLIISESKTLEEAKNRDIDSFILSIFCENQFELLKTNDNAFISADEIGKVNVQNLVLVKYKSIIKELDLNKYEIQLLEDRLLSKEGFRWPVYLYIVYYNPNIRKEIIEALQEKKILKQYFIDGQPVIEIIHDKYALAIKFERDFKLKAIEEQLKIAKEKLDYEKKKSEDEKDLALKHALARQIELQLLNEREELERDKIEEEKKLALKKAQIINYSLICAFLVVLICTYIVAHNVVSSSNRAYSFAAIATIDTLSNKRIALKALVIANENFNKNNSEDDLIRQGQATSKLKILNLFNQEGFGTNTIQDSLTSITGYNIFNYDSRILIGLHNDSENTNTPYSNLYMLYDGNGRLIKNFKNKQTIQVDNSNYVAVIDSPKIIIYNDEKPIATIIDTALFNINTPITSIQYFDDKKSKQVLIINNKAPFKLYSLNIKAKLLRPITISNEQFTDKNLNQINSGVILTNGDILSIKQTQTYYYTYTYSYLLMSKLNDYHENRNFTLAQRIIISPDKSSFVVKKDNKWFLYRDNSFCDLKDTITDSQVKFDNHGNFIIAGKYSVNFYLKDGSSAVYKQITRNNTKSSFRILDFKSPVISYCEWSSKADFGDDQKNSHLKVFNFISKEFLIDKNCTNLIDCRFTNSVDSLIIITKADANEPRQVYFNYELYSIKKKKDLTRFGLYNNETYNYLVLNSFIPRSANILEYSSDYTSQYYFGIVASKSLYANNLANMFLSGSANTGINYKRIRFYNAQHPIVAFTDSLKLITTWIKDSIKVNRSEQLKIDKILHTRNPWFFTVDY